MNDLMNLTLTMIFKIVALEPKITDLNYLATLNSSIALLNDNNTCKKRVRNVSEYIQETQMNNFTDVKYILQWTSSNDVPFVYMGKGHQGFIDRRCYYKNCFVTDDRNFFGGDITRFDVIAFAGPQTLLAGEKIHLPDKRSPQQKYVFASIESSHYYPVCSKKFDRFFNWTWTFKLDSEVKWGFIVIKDQDRNIIGPKKKMNWIPFEKMSAVREKIKRQLRKKSKVAAWFVSNCRTRSGREKFVANLQHELRQYGLKVDIYGKCGTYFCPTPKQPNCNDLIKDNYFFYLSFENAFSEDYVTEKLLTAVQNYAVPIVYGGADYSRFLPAHSYLNARELGAKQLAEKIYFLVRNRDYYYEYFRWREYYSYYNTKDSVLTDEYCSFCKILNDRQMVNEKTVYHNFKVWWDPPNHC